MEIANKFKNEITNIDLMITENCNLKCEYCFATKNATVMSVEEGKKILDRMKELSPNQMTITFFGGEPFLFPHTVYELSLYAVELWKEHCRLHIVTNATYFDLALFTALRQLPFSIQVSIDGDEVTNKEHRDGDFTQITENIKEIRKLFPEVSARMTFTPKTVGRLAINIEYLHRELGIKKIMHHAVMEAPWTDADINKYQYQLNQIYHYRRFCLKNNIPLDVAFVDKPLSIVNEDSRPSSNFCEAGKSYLAILPNGDCYPCHRACSARIFKLGNIFDEIPFIRGVFLTIDKNSTGCKQNCDAASTCHSCIITHYKVNGELTRPISQYCKICQIEHQQAQSYLQTEINDRQQNLLLKMSRVVANIAEDLENLKSREVKNNG